MRIAPALVIFALMTCCLPAWCQEIAQEPDAASLRMQVDELIRRFKDQHKKATPGMIQQAIGFSIAFGAPAYNKGDHGGCASFYLKTAESLTAAFAAEESATAAGRESLSDLKTALDRSKGVADPDRIAWALRFAFDKNQLACVLQTQRAQSLVAMGEEYFKRSEFAEAQDAFESAVMSLSELDGQALETIPIGCRYAPLALGNSLFAQQKFKQASHAVAKGLDYLPQWPKITVDLRGFHHDPAEYESILSVLKSKVSDSPGDADLQFLLGYEYWFTGRRDDARVAFEHTLKLAPDHPGAKRFIEAGHAPTDKPRV